MKKQIFVLLAVGFLSINASAQTSATPLQTSTESESLLSLSSYSGEGVATLGTWAPPNGRTSAGRYVTLFGKVTHRNSGVALSGALNFAQTIAAGTRETATAFDNPTVNLTKGWNNAGWFDEVQAGTSTTFVGNRDTAKTTYRGSFAPNLKTVKKMGSTTWTQTLAYSAGFYGQDKVVTDDETKENVTDVLKSGQALSYAFTDALTVTAYGHFVHAVTATSREGQSRILGCLGAEYALNKSTVLGFGYGSGVNFLGLDPMADQLALAPYNDSGYVELNLMF